MERVSREDIPKGMFENLMVIENYINDSPLDLKLLELIRLRVAQVNNCTYCVNMHRKELKDAGEIDERIASLNDWRETTLFSEKEKAVLNFTEKLTKISSEQIDDELIDSLSNHFNKSEICYLTLAVSQINTWTRLMKTFNFPS
ncbi:MAG: carboxymuconolactone decarboxylase [Flavobacteriales bacterium]|nr:MAG: carboxymuconolactone decarboxylase [Flavobacteriales bacterium]